MRKDDRNIVEAESISNSTVQQAQGDINNYYNAIPKLGTDILDQLKQINTKLDKPSIPNLSRLNDDNEDTKLHGQINALQGLIDDGDVYPALKNLLALKEKEWENANNSEKYRLLISIASAKLKLGETSEAGTSIIEAYKISPEYKNAEQNLATAYLILQDYPKAKKHARLILEKDKNNAYAASILIQSLIKDDNCKDPLSYIPDELHESEDVLIGYIHYLRTKEMSEWTTEAFKAFEKYPENIKLKLFYAEAILDIVTKANQSNDDGSENGSIEPCVFQKAVEILYSQAKSQIETCSELLTTVVNNASLALRLINDIPRAKEILDLALAKRPYDPNLKLQRAIVARIENDPEDILKILKDIEPNPEVLSLKIGALIDIKELDEALDILNSINEEQVPDYVKRQLLLDRCYCQVKMGQYWQTRIPHFV